MKRKICLVFIGVVLAFASLEAGLRIAGYVYNARQERANKKALATKGTYRILCIGESTTEGAYPQYLESILNKSNTGIQFSVIDEGHSGSTTNFLVGMIEDYIERYRPNMIVAMMGANDGMEGVVYEESVISKLLNSVRAFRLISLIRYHVKAKMKEKKEEGTPGMFSRLLSKGNATAIDNNPATKKAMKINSANEQEYLNLGELYTKQGECEKAENMFRRAIGINPRSENAYLKLGELYHSQGKNKEAIREYHAVLKINQKNEYAYIGIGNVYTRQKRFQEAEVAYKKASAITSTQQILVYTRMLELYMYEESRQEKIQKCLENILKLEENNLKANIGIYVELIKNSKYPEALHQYKKITGTHRGWGKEKNIIFSPFYPAEYAMIKVGPSVVPEYFAETIYNYEKLARISQGKVTLVCMQYPLRSVEPLKETLKLYKEIVFVDNEEVFKNRVRKEGYDVYFMDRFAGDFGHCTVKGNMLLAENLANTILKEVFDGVDIENN